MQAFFLIGSTYARSPTACSPFPSLERLGCSGSRGAAPAASYSPARCCPSDGFSDCVPSRLPPVIYGAMLCDPRPELLRVEPAGAADLVARQHAAGGLVVDPVLVY